MAKYRGLVSRSKEDFVRHYHDTHGEELPVWVAVEVMDFGALSQLFSMLNVNDQSEIARRYGVNDWKVFASWLFSLSYLRNLVAHHSRVWNRNITSKPKLPKRGQMEWCDSFIDNEDTRFKPFLLVAITTRASQICLPQYTMASSIGRALVEISGTAFFPKVGSDRDGSS